MDVWTSIQCASSVLGILDVTGKVLSLWYEAYTGSSSLDLTVDDLKAYLERLRCIQRDARARSQTDVQIQDLCRRCEGVATSLIDIIGKICRRSQTGPSAWSSLRQAVQTLWKKTEINYLKTKLESDQQQLAFLVVAAFRSEHAETRDTVKIIAERVEQLGSYQTNFSIDDKFTSDLLVHLQYKEMESRYSSIDRVHKNTGNWIFKPGGDEHNFVRWMEQTRPVSDIFWITGKPGSGKSTLMKYIVNAKETLSSFEAWAGASEPLLVLSSYLWISGGVMQKNRAGLLRRLLYQAVSEHNHLGPAAFKDRARAYAYFGRLVWEDPWTDEELQNVLRQLVAKARETMKVVIFIDGLDEYEGEPREIIQLLDSLRGPSTKLCVSSRPWTAFEEKFAYKPNLRMERLNKPDIDIYVADKLREHPRYINPALTAELIGEIQQKARGVFLWVYLVTRILTDALTNGERAQDLRRLIDSLPSELGNLFDRILRPLEKDSDPEAFRKASELLQIVLAERNMAPAAIKLLYAMESNREAIFQLQVQGLRAEVRREKIEEIKWMVTARTKCLLEVVDVPDSVDWFDKTRIQFLHRTVGDYLRDPTTLQTLIQGTQPTDKHPVIFNADERLALAHLALLKTCVLFGGVPEGNSDYLETSILIGMQYILNVPLGPDTKSTLYRFLKDGANTILQLSLRKHHATHWDHMIRLRDHIWVEKFAVTSCAHERCSEEAFPLIIAARFGLDGYVKDSLPRLPSQCRDKWGVYLFTLKSMFDAREHSNLNLNSVWRFPFLGQTKGGSFNNHVGFGRDAYKEWQDEVKKQSRLALLHRIFSFGCL
ncbi:hypothetical protein QBC44DRAFT_273911 [Cladorrhinum sp. PSN332]|nr:hypothetical protein QBC44DRAFT_273911 [Cladorrhinum sp. PSN332]